MTYGNSKAVTVTTYTRKGRNSVLLIHFTIGFFKFELVNSPSPESFLARDLWACDRARLKAKLKANGLIGFVNHLNQAVSFLG